MARVLELTEEQEKQLEEMAQMRDSTIEELITSVVEGLLRTPVTRARPTEEQRRRALALSGAFDFGVSDLAENHDAYLAEAFSHDHLR